MALVKEIIFGVGLVVVIYFVVFTLACAAIVIGDLCDEWLTKKKYFNV